MVKNISILRPKAVQARRGRSRSAHYKDITDGLFVPSISIGNRAVGTPDYEVDTMISAQIEGRSNEELQALVKELVAARKDIIK